MGGSGEVEHGVLPDWLRAWDIPPAAKILAETAVYSQLVLTIRGSVAVMQDPSAEGRGWVTGVPDAAERAAMTQHLSERHTRLLADLSMRHPLPDGRAWDDVIRDQALVLLTPAEDGPP